LTSASAVVRPARPLPRTATVFEVLAFEEEEDEEEEEREQLAVVLEEECLTL